MVIIIIPPYSIVETMKAVNSIQNSDGHINKCSVTVNFTSILLLFIFKVFADEGDKLTFQVHTMVWNTGTLCNPLLLILTSTLLGPSVLCACALSCAFNKT